LYLRLEHLVGRTFIETIWRNMEQSVREKPLKLMNLFEFRDKY